MVLVKVYIDKGNMHDLLTLVQDSYDFNMGDWDKSCFGLLRDKNLIQNEQGYDSIGKYLSLYHINLETAMHLGRYLDDPEHYHICEKPDVLTRIRSLMAVDVIYIDNNTGEIVYTHTASTLQMSFGSLV